MKYLLDHTLRRRARALAGHLAAHLPQRGYVLDVGAGTGHNSQMLRQIAALKLVNFVDADVVNMRVVPGDAVLFDGVRLPFPPQTFACTLLIFVLHYVDQPLSLLQEIQRVTSGPVLLLQTTYTGKAGALIAQSYDYLWGPVAFTVARAVGLVTAQQHALQASQFYTRQRLWALVTQAGFVPQLLTSFPWPGVPVRYDLVSLTRRGEAG